MIVTTVIRVVPATRVVVAVNADADADTDADTDTDTDKYTLTQVRTYVRTYVHTAMNPSSTCIHALHTYMVSERALRRKSPPRRWRCRGWTRR